MPSPSIGSVVRRAGQLLLAAVAVVLMGAVTVAAAVAFGIIEVGPRGAGVGPGAQPSNGAAAVDNLPSPSPTFLPVPPGAGSDPVVVGAGDIADCLSDGARRTSDLIEAMGTVTVFAAGDLAYETGTPEQYRACYAPTWGRFKDVTRPVPGNRDWAGDLAGYRDYWGSRALGEDGQTWYSFDLGSWHVVMLDSECDRIGGCAEDSPEGRWLKRDLAASKARCTLGVWHHPRFSSGEHGDYTRTSSLWSSLSAAGGDLVISAHDHDYERFDPLDASGRRDPRTGMALFVVGTGGGELGKFGAPHPGSAVRIGSTHGVLRLVLHPTGYGWEFITVDGATVDTGTGDCH